MNDLLKLRAARRKEQIGFESQQRTERDAKRKQERHQWAILLAEAKVDGQQLHDLNRDIKDSERLRVFYQIHECHCYEPGSQAVLGQQRLEIAKPPRRGCRAIA
jgi:hypothetical protein